MRATLLSKRKLDMIRGKALTGRATLTEIMHVFHHIDAMEQRLDEADNNDLFGTEGWRHWFRSDK